MAILGVDPSAFLREHLSEPGLALAASRPATVGHVHLSVGDVDTAKRFYADQLGFEVTQWFGSQAVFVSAGGYHHHMAMNTWNSRGAGRRQQTLGRGLVRIEVPSADDLGALNDRLGHHRIARRDDGQVLGFEDPWANRVEVTVKQ